ncbi:MAG: hypothetical protein IJ228_08755 [Succinivibrio sp.]|nr:hypothetical protein [Succinivibrio sp.]
MTTEAETAYTESTSHLSDLIAKRNVLCAFLMDFIPEEDSSAWLELTVLRRAEIFSQYLKVQPWLITHTYQPRLVEGALRQQSLGRLTCAKIANLYDYLQDITRGVTPPQHLELKLPEGAVIRNAPQHSGFFIADDAGHATSFVHYANPALIGQGVPDCINHLRDNHIVSRTVYDPLGFISREEEVNPATGEALVARYFRPDGTLALVETFPEKSDTSGVINSATVYDHEGQKVFSCDYKDELVCWWLNSLLRYGNFLPHNLQSCPFSGETPNRYFP